tara:strand:+ start:995 stop:1951 length:957 start_codon:yes stop_codon:yes gene_type:complete
VKPNEIREFSVPSLQVAAGDALAHQVIDLADHEDDLIEEMAADRSITGIKLPWEKTHELVRLREGEYSVFCGQSGHFKSTLAFQIALWAMREAKVGIASMEMRRSDVEDIFCQQAAGDMAGEIPSESFKRQLLRWQKGRMLLFDHFGMIQPLKILGVLRNMLNRGCELVILDSMMLCNVTDNLDAEKAFCAELAKLSDEFCAHIMVIHHTRKLSREQGGVTGTPTRDDVRGSGAITDLASSLFIVVNDKYKADLLRRKNAYGVTLSEKESKYVETRPCQRLIVSKQRHNTFEGSIGLYKHPSRQFLSKPSAEAMNFEI